MKSVLSVGEIMLEMSDQGNDIYKKSYAGDTFTVAYYLNLVSGGNFQAEYLTALGNDAKSENCFQFMERKGVLTSNCIKDLDRTIGLFILSNDKKGEKQYNYWRSQSAARHIFDENRDLTGYEYVYFSGITAAITKHRENLLEDIKTAHATGSKIYYDINHRKQLWLPDEARNFAEHILPQLDLVKISDEELPIIFPDSTIGELSALYPKPEWVFTCGGEKAEIWKEGELLCHNSFKSVPEVVDSSGAGDSFMGVFLEGKLSGRSYEEILPRAHEVASQVVC
ncbi:PfkB family carbohydrate kinase [Kiloniella sp. EL199]|uniref:PfkB family carbohydrate kinase n=1 Tax=Kiloniella sp. EL199 TaxID=2107581 RepID=UPI000EA2FD8B|nr:PfkB family carbohydrate kinase [Kiloniella sp. EL199]